MRFLTALFLPAALAAQANSFTPAPSPAAEGFSAARLARIDSMVNEVVTAGKINGAVVFISRNGHVVVNKAYGVRNVETRAPLRADDIFRIASQSKAITSLAVMMLWEEGRFQLDDPISRYLPEFANATVLKTFNAADSTYTTEPAKGPITIRQLLTHTSGLDYPAIGSDELRAIYAKAGIPSGIGASVGSSIGEKMRILGGLPLRHQPGESFTYSLGLDVLGYLVEVVSGIPFDRFLRSRIFDPLGMKDTWFFLPADRAARLVTLHDGASGKAVVRRDPVFDGADPMYPTFRGTYFSGGAGLSSTAEDYAKFLQLFLNKGEFNGVRLLSPRTVELMLTDQMPALKDNYGLGFGLETAQNDWESPKSIGSFSWGGAFQTIYWGDPKQGLIAQIYTNMMNSPVTDLGGRFMTLVYSAMTR